MGQVRRPGFRVEYALTPEQVNFQSYVKAAWRGRTSEKALLEWVEKTNRSYQPGGINERSATLKSRNLSVRFARSTSPICQTGIG